MKKAIFGVVCAAALLLCGCSADDTAVAIVGNTAVVSGAEISFPEGWTVTSGDALYEQMAEQAGCTAEELRTSYDEAGLTYYAQASSGDYAVMAVISSLDMTLEDGEQTTLADYARTVHDSTIFEYLASGYKTGKDSSFGEVEYGDKQGWLSCFEVFSADEEPQFMLGFSEFFFQQESCIYTIQVCYFDADKKAEAMSVIETISAA